MSVLAKIADSFKKPRAGKFILALALFFVLNIVLAKITGHERADTAESRTQQLNLALKDSNVFEPMYATWPWWMAHQYKAETKAPDVVLLGSSQMNSVAWGPVAHYLKKNLDCVVHRRVEPLQDGLRKRLSVADLSVFNCALSGTMASDFYFISEALLSGNRAPKVAIVGVSPRDFIDNFVPGVSSTDSFRLFARFVPKDKYFNIAYPGPDEQALAILQEQVDSVYLRSLHTFVEQKMHPGNDQKEQAGTKAGGAKENVMTAIMGDTTNKLYPGFFCIPPDFPPFFGDNTYEYMRRYGNAKKNEKNLETQLKFFRWFLANMQQNNVRVIVVGMPLLPENRAMLSDLFWNNFHSRISNACSESNATYINLCASPKFRRSDFCDTVHVNPAGGYKLMKCFEEAVVSDRIASQRLSDRQVASTLESLQ